MTDALLAAVAQELTAVHADAGRSMGAIPPFQRSEIRRMNQSTPGLGGP